MIFWLLLFLPAFATASAPTLAELSRSPEWLRILHYKTHWLGGFSSSVDGEGFFLSPNGARDPESELRATLSALESGGGTFGKLQQPAGCAFPLRRRFLERSLEKKFPAEACPEFTEFLKKLDPAGVTLVFATAFPGNPASMFGHSFLKIRGRDSTVLDWSVNYAAMVPMDENPFTFAAFGLAGGYRGQFALTPYYAKIEEYGYSEGRDMWEYDLALNESQVQTLLEAVWELETNTYFHYFFFDENCSYQILTLLEIVRPDWDLSGYFLHVIPGESVKRVAAAPRALAGVRLRPSLERRLRAVAERMGESDWAAFRASEKSGDPAGLGGLSLQAYLLFLQAEKKREGENWAREAELKRALGLRARAEKEKDVTNFGGESGRPDLGHGAYRLGLGPARNKAGGWGAELSFHLAYHDLLDSDLGYLPHSEVLFPGLRFRFAEQRLRLEEAQLLSLVSLTPRNVLRWPFAWRTQIGYRPLLDLECDSCQALHAEAGAGKALALLPERWTIWSILGLEADGGNALPASARAAGLLELGSLFTLPGEGKILFESRLVRGIQSPWRVDFHGGISQPISQNWASRIEARSSYVWKKDAVSVDGRILAMYYF